MAYPTVDGPYGLQPVKMLDNSPYNGATRLYRIATTYDTNIFHGDVVTLVTGGTVERDTADAAMTPIGVFMGCTYTDPGTSQKTFKQYWPADTAASDAVGYIIDDPNALYQMQADATMAQATLGANAPLAAVQSTSTGSTTTGNSTSALDATVAVTTGIAFRIVDFVDGPDSAVGDSYTDVIVKFNGHSYNNPVGI